MAKFALVKAIKGKSGGSEFWVLLQSEGFESGFWQQRSFCGIQGRSDESLACSDTRGGNRARIIPVKFLGAAP